MKSMFLAFMLFVMVLSGCGSDEVGSELLSTSSHILKENALLSKGNLLPTEFLSTSSYALREDWYGFVDTREETCFQEKLIFIYPQEHFLVVDEHCFHQKNNFQNLSGLSFKVILQQTTEKSLTILSGKVEYKKPFITWVQVENYLRICNFGTQVDAKLSITPLYRTNTSPILLPDATDPFNLNPKTCLDFEVVGNGLLLLKQLDSKQVFIVSVKRK